MDTRLILDVLYIWFYFIVYAFGGWIAQGIYVGLKDRKFVNTGFFHGPVVPIYGFGAIFIIFIVDKISPNPFWVFVNSFWITSVLEYVTSWYLEMRYHRLWWDYSKRFLNINGRVCLLNSTLYGIGGWFITYLSQPILTDIAHWLPLWLLILFDVATAVAFLSDVISTEAEMKSHKLALEHLHQHVQAAIKARQQEAEANLEEIHAHIAQAKKNLEEMQATSRHLRGMIHQHLDENYQASIEQLRKVLNELENQN